MQNIAGVPLGTRIKAINLVYPYPAIIYRENNATVELEPDNVYKVLDLEMVPIPEGYRRKGATAEEWFRPPSNLEYWITAEGYLAIPTCYSVANKIDQRRIILEPIKRTEYVFTVEYIISKETAEALWPQPDAERDRNFTQRRSKPLTTRIEEREI